MALWRFGRGWSEAAMKSYLSELAGRTVNFDVPPEQMTRANGWTIDGAETTIGIEPPGPPTADGPFTLAKRALINYDFSDPTIVVGHFDPNAPFVGRDMLLEMKVMGFRFLTGVRVHGVRDEVDDGGTMFGFRYDTLEGHIEQGFEWFLLSKVHATGRIDFAIEAHWQLGDFPNLWSKAGFKLIGEHYRSAWRHRAPLRLRRLAFHPVEEPDAGPGGLAHRGGEEPETTNAPPAVGAEG